MKSSLILRRRVLLAAAVTASLLPLLPSPAKAKEPTPITVTVDPTKPGDTISPVFAGLSFETQMLLPNEKGQRYFRPDNTALIALFRSMGITCLRIGGNTADRATVPIPTTADIDSLYAFAQKAGVKVIYTLRLKGVDDPADAAKTAKYIQDHYAANTLFLAIGNEPNVYAKIYPAYKELWSRFQTAISAPDAAPTAKFGGPSCTPGKASWARDFARDFGKAGPVTTILQHAYPGGAGGKVPDPATGRDRMLSPEWLLSYEKVYRSFVPAVQESGLKYRLEEANSFFNGGAAGASDTFAAALWGLDYLYWWASHGADGINFHTGDRKTPGATPGPMTYAAYEMVSESGYSVRPLGYATKAFDLGGHGRLVPAQVESKDGATANLTAYAVAGGNGDLYITLINKAHAAGASASAVTLSVGDGYARSGGSVAYLTAPGNDVAVTSGITLGGSSIQTDGTWSGTWQPLAAPTSGGKYTISLSPASAAVVHLQNSK